jgi:hypothetical protein
VSSGGLGDGVRLVALFGRQLYRPNDPDCPAMAVEAAMREVDDAKS